MATVIMWQTDETGLNFDYVTLDACEEQDFSFSTKITEHPVEDGTIIADHSIMNPDNISLEGIQTNAPVEYLAALRFPSDRAEQALSKLLYVCKNSIPVTLMTSLLYYENILITNIDVKRNAKIGDSVPLSLKLREIITVESETVDAPTPSMDRAKAKSNTGSKSKADTTPKQQQKISLLGSLFS